jgi:hypothetical protein
MDVLLLASEVECAFVVRVRPIGEASRHHEAADRISD